MWPCPQLGISIEVRADAAFVGGDWWMDITRDPVIAQGAYAGVPLTDANRGQRSIVFVEKPHAREDASPTRTAPWPTTLPRPHRSARQRRDHALTFLIPRSADPTHPSHGIASPISLRNTEIKASRRSC